MTTFNLGSTGTKPFPFETVGATVTGKVVNLEEIQQTDIAAGTPKFWADGTPKMMHRLTLATSLRDPSDPADDGHRALYLRGSRKSETKSVIAAVLDAVRAATGGTELAFDGTLTVTYVGDGARTNAGFNPPKQYQASYTPPSMNLETAPAQQPAHTASPPSAPYIPPATQQPTTPANGYTPEQLAALKAAGIDPASLQPQS